MDTLLALDEDLKQIPNITLSNTVYSYEYHLSNGNQAISDQLKEKIMTDIENDHMAPYYVHLCSKFSWVVDEVKLNQMR
jgi:glutaminase